MLLALMFPFVTAGMALTPTPRVLADPPIKVWLNSDGQFTRGDRAKVKVKSTDDG